MELLRPLTVTCQRQTQHEAIPAVDGAKCRRRDSKEYKKDELDVGKADSNKPEDFLGERLSGDLKAALVNRLSFCAL